MEETLKTDVNTNALEAIFEASATSEQYVEGFFRRLAEVAAQVDPTSMARVITTIEKAGREGRAIYFVANGGSAAVASHIVNDLGPNALVEGQPGFRVFCLADNVESVTAIANDLGFEFVFEHQLRNLLKEGDVVVALSVSGNSENVVRAIEYANAHGATTIGWCGFDGGRLAKICDLAIHLPTTRDEYGPVEDVFSNLGHVLTGYLTMKRGGKLSH